VRGSFIASVVYGHVRSKNKTAHKGQDEKVAAVLISIIARRRFDVGVMTIKVNTPWDAAHAIRSTNHKRIK